MTRHELRALFLNTVSSTMAVTFGIGIVVIAIAVAFIFYANRGSHLELPGKILKVRTAPLDEKSAAVVIDFRVTNPSNVTFMTREVTVVLEDKSGKQTEGATSSEMDAQRLMAGIPLLGQKYNPSLIVRTQVAPHSSLDRMVAARFEVPDDELQARKRFLVRIEEVDGATVEYSEK
jgi:hypothetical protein